MKTLAVLAGLAGALAIGSAASAGTYNFSYLGLDGDTFAGSFTGSVNGDVVDVTSVKQVTFNGQAFTGPLAADSYIGGGNYQSGGAVVSLTNPSNDNFLFIGPGNPASNYFYVIPWSNGPANPIAVQGAFNGEFYDNYNGEFIPSNLSVSAVPEPSVWLMMIAGLAMIGGALRNSRKRGVGVLTTV